MYFLLLFKLVSKQLVSKKVSFWNCYRNQGIEIDGTKTLEQYPALTAGYEAFVQDYDGLKQILVGLNHCNIGKTD